MTAARIAIPLVLVAGLLAGCGIHDPYDKSTATATATTAATAATTTTRAVAATTAVPATTAPAPAPAPAPVAATPEAAIRRFAKVYMNWSFDALAETRRGLLPQAVGPLRAQLLDDAKRAGAASAQSAASTTHSGTVEGVLIRHGQPALVITRENTDFGQGQEQEQVMVYSVQAQRTARGWKLASWTAED